LSPVLASSVVETSALNGLASMSYSGTVVITMDSTKCANAVYLCVSVLSTGTPPYTDKNNANNYRCKNIAEQLSCAVGEYCRFDIIVV
jgi:phosphoribosylcarboxyaminoimidazole (NCAIR) mutase